MYKIVLELKKAHDMGFFHMDIKPLNILVDSEKRGDRF
jgi:serine/threonine protein kinase